MSFNAQELIRGRKSVRTFNGIALNASDRAALEKFIESVPNPLGIPVEFRLLDAKEHDLSSPVIIGTDLYMAAKVRRCKNYEVGYGYSFESACLYAKSLGIGTVMLAVSLSRKTFEKAMELQDGEEMLVASPVGYPSAKRSVRENMMRRGIKADERFPFEELFYKDAFGNGIKKENAGVFSNALEMVRLAPSGINKQPWRVVIDGDKAHFYEFKTVKDNPQGDMQKIDMGIAMAHFDLTMQEEGHCGKFIESDPGLEIPSKAIYIISYELEK